MAAPRKYPDELRERAIRLVLDAKEDPATRPTRRAGGSADSWGSIPETLRSWVKQAQIDAGDRPGTTHERRPADQRAASGRMRELRRANEILKAASAFFAAELDRPRPGSRRSSTPIGTSSGSSRSAGC